MAPKRTKGLTRMDAAVDALRPMGFKDSCIRKCVRDLLKVYGNEGWWFIEDSAYKVLLETIIDLPEEPPCLEYAPEPLLEENVDDSRELLVSEPEPCKAVVVGGEEAPPVNSSSFQTLLEEIDAIEDEDQGQKLEAVVAPKLLEDASAGQSQDGVCIGFTPASACTPQVRDIAPKTKKPSYGCGWISDDDEDDDSHQLNSAS